MKRKLSALLTAVVLASVFFVSGCVNTEKTTRTGYAFDTVIKITVYGECPSGVMDNCFDMCAEYENVFSPTLNTSELFLINSRTATHAGDDLLSVITAASHVSSLSDGALDITMGRISAAWGFSSSDPSVPDREFVASCLENCGMDSFEVSDGNIIFGNTDVCLDLGAVAKGYIADRIGEYLISEGVSGAVIDLGGNILCVGSKNGGKPFSVAVKKPEKDSTDIAAMLEITDMSVVTSGVYERGFESDGVMYHHILDPKTGYPCRSGLLSVTVVAGDSVTADALSTALFVMGKDDGIELVNSLEGVYAMFITEDGSYLFSQGAEELFVTN